MKKSLCNVCLQPISKDPSGSMTQWVSVCQCHLKNSEAELFSTLMICQVCFKRVNLARHGSFTQWIFRTDFCKCYSPEISSTNQRDNTDRPLSKIIDYPELENIESDFPFSRFKPIELLGKGVSGIVYRCQDKLLNKIVAVKVMQDLKPELVVSFQTEAKLTSKLNHPRIVQIIDISTTDSGTPYMVFEYVLGVSLAAYLSQNGPIQWKTAIELAIELCEGLEYAHQRGVFHRDLKPDNVMLVKDDNDSLSVKIIDFGIGLSIGTEQHTLEFQGKTFAGTPPYMSPDQANGKRFDSRSEMYSLGCILYETLTGQTPWAGESTLEILNSQLHKAPSSVSALISDPSMPQKVDQIVNRCLKNSPDDRYPSISSLKNALTDCLTVKSPPKDTASDKDTEAEPSSKILYWVCSILTILAMIIIAFPYLFSETPKARSANKINVSQKAEFLPPIESNHMANIEALNNSGEYKVNSFFTDDDLKDLANRTEIKSIHLYGSLISGKGLVHLINLPLTSIYLNGLDITDEDIKPLAKIQTLTCLGLCNTKVTGKNLDQFKTLSNVDITRAPITIEGFEAISKNDNLASIVLTAKQLNSPGFKQFAKNICVNRVCLTYVTRDIKNLDILSNLKYLCGLSLINGLIEPSLIANISKLQLDTLDINPVCKMTQETVNSFANLKKLRKLTIAPSILNSPLIGNIKKKLPGLEITEFKATTTEDLVDMYFHMAKRGNAKAQHIIASHYRYGINYPKDITKSVYWYSKAAKQGYSRSQWCLASIYLTGMGSIKQDKMLAFKYCQLAANQNLPDAILQLGHCYYDGIGIEKDQLKGLQLTEKTANMGFAPAQFEMYHRLMRVKNPSKEDQEIAVDWCRKAADQGYAKAQYRLGYCYFNGLVVEPDQKKAVQYFQIAANKNVVSALYMLGHCYEKGLGGLAVNKKEAIRLYNEANSKGSKKARIALDALTNK